MSGYQPVRTVPVVGLTKHGLRGNDEPLQDFLRSWVKMDRPPFWYFLDGEQNAPELYRARTTPFSNPISRNEEGKGASCWLSKVICADQKVDGLTGGNGILPKP